MAAWQHAFDEIAATRGDALVRYAYVLTGDATEAADLVQEGLLRTFRRARLGTDLHSVEAYVRTAMLHAYLDSGRRKQRFTAMRHLLASDNTREGVDDAVSVRDDVRTALGRLTPMQRACVVLRFYEDLPVAGVARQLGCSEGSVKRHLSDAMTRLAPALRVEEKG